jgi:hypothetical protein
LSRGAGQAAIIHHLNNRVMNKESIVSFIKQNYIAFAIGVFFYLVYLQFTFAGNRICDCETTEKYRPAATAGTRVGVNRFYHK